MFENAQTRQISSRACSDGTRQSSSLSPRDRPQGESASPVARVAKQTRPGCSMAVNNNLRVPLACAHSAISSLMLASSVAIFVGAIYVKYELSDYFGYYFEDYLETPVLILITGSVLVFADASLGLISLAQKWARGLKTFLACTVCLLVAMVTIVAIVYMNLDDTEEAMFSRLEGDLKNHEISMDAIDAVQKGLQCCGYKDSGDWANETGKNVPESCCISVRVGCDPDNSLDIYSTGCYRAIRDFLDCRKWIAFIVLAVLALIEIISIVISVTVCRNISRAINSGSPATDNRTRDDAALPRVRNPLGQDSLSPVDNGRNYVRRPSQLPAVLNYRSPHENFLRHAPQLRFDRRVMLPSSQLKNPHAGGSR